jgi:hypothetical protein
VQTLVTPPPVDDRSGWRDIHTPPPVVAKPRGSGLALGIAAVVVAVGLAAGIGAYAGGWRGPDWMFPGRQAEIQRVAAFTSQRREVEGVVSQLRTAIDDVRRAGDARDWTRMRTLLGNADATMGRARTAAIRLKELSKTTDEIAAANALTRDIEGLAGRAADMRRTLDKGLNDVSDLRIERDRQLLDRDIGQRLSRLDRILGGEDDRERRDRELRERLARVERVLSN